MTIAISAIAAKPILQNVDQQIQSGKVQETQKLELIYNSGTDSFEWANHSDKVIYFTKASDIASNTTTNIWASLGNVIDITGTTDIDSFSTAPQAGAFRKCKATNLTRFLRHPTHAVQRTNQFAIAMIGGIRAYDPAMPGDGTSHLNGDFIGLGATATEYHTVDTVMMEPGESFGECHDTFM